MSHRLFIPMFMSLFFLMGIVGILFILIYPWIYHAFFSYLPEAEVQTYCLGLLVAFGLISLWYIVSCGDRISTLLLRIGTLRGLEQMVTSGIVAMIVLLMLYFLWYIWPSPDFREQLRTMGITVTGEFNYVLFAVLILLYYVVLSIHKKIHLSRTLLFSLVFVTIILLTFDVGFLSWNDHVNYAGPILDILHGKAPLTFFAQYGFLSYIAVAQVFRIVPLSLLNLTIVTAIAQIVGFIVLYFLCTKIFRSRIYAFFATTAAILTSWVVVGTIRNAYPQSTVLRFGMWMAVALAIYYSNAYKHVAFRILEIASVVFAFFWTFDIGVEILIAYLLFHLILSLKSTFIGTIRAFIPKVLITIGSIGATFLVINLIYRFFGITTQWQYFFGGAFTFLGNILLIAVPRSLIPIAYYLPLIVVLAYIVAKKRSNSVLDAKDSALLFISCFGMVLFIYFMGRSYLNNLNYISAPMVVCFFVLLDRLGNTHKLARVTGALLLALPSYFVLPQAAQNLSRENIVTSIQFIRHPTGTERDLVGGTTDMLTARYGSYIKDYGIALLSHLDTWYLVLLNQTNLLGNNCYFCLYAPQLVQPVLDRMRDNTFTYIFIDADRSHIDVQLSQSQVEWLTQELTSRYRLKETLGALDVYERK